MDADLKNAALAIFQPLIGYLMEQGWTYPMLSEVLKQVYVTQALRQNGNNGEGMTDSRVSLLTGIHRKDVKRLRASTREDTNPPMRRSASLAARVVAEWVSTPRYLDSRSKPKPLAIYARSGKLSFEALVKAVKADMRPASVLDELVRAGVARVEKDHVRLVRNAYVSALPHDKLAFLGANVGDHLRAALHNISGKQPLFIERAVYYGSMDGDSLGRMQSEMVDHAEQFLQEVNRLVMPLSATANREDTKNPRRMRLGVYYYEDDDVHAVERSGRKRKKGNEISGS